VDKLQVDHWTASIEEVEKRGSDMGTVSGRRAVARPWEKRYASGLAFGAVARFSGRPTTFLLACHLLFSDQWSEHAAGRGTHRPFFLTPHTIGLGSKQTVRLWHEH
jgi:hypothetical protein